MRVSIEGIIKRCTSILDDISEFESLEGYSQDVVSDIVKDLNEKNPGFYSQFLKEFSYNLKLIKTKIDSVEIPEEKLKLIDELFNAYCISSFKDENEQQKLLK